MFIFTIQTFGNTFISVFTTSWLYQLEARLSCIKVFINNMQFTNIFSFDPRHKGHLSHEHIGWTFKNSFEKHVVNIVRCSWQHATLLFMRFSISLKHATSLFVQKRCVKTSCDLAGPQLMRIIMRIISRSRLALTLPWPHDNPLITLINVFNTVFNIIFIHFRSGASW